MLRFTDAQRESLHQAADDVNTMAPDDDFVDLACNTGNFFWTGLDDRQARAALRWLDWHRMSV